jgi:hypothetical protein
MAFNPFHAFRKHQKVVFAALTIICMLTFVLASGVGGSGRGRGGDFFEEMARWVGKKSARDVARLYGSTVDLSEIVQLRMRRQAANNYIVNAIIAAHDNVLGAIVDAIGADMPSPGGGGNEAKQAEKQNLAFSRQLAFRFPQFAQEYQRRLDQYDFRLRQAEASANTAKNTADAMRLADLRAKLLALRQQFDWLVLPNKDDLYPGGNLYFGGSISVEGLLDFMIWLHEADRLGIQLSNDDIKQAVDAETLNALSGRDDHAIRMSMAREGIGSGPALLAALGDEFRVRLAQAAIVGFDPGGFNMPPPLVTPSELLDYYRRERTEVSLSMLPIPVSKFVPQVKAKPTQEELKALYDAHKDEEYNPEQETPGFKQPRQIQVAWVDLSRDAKATRDEARRMLLSEIAATTSNPLVGTALTVELLKQFPEPNFPGFERNWGHFEMPRLDQADFSLAMETYKSLNRPETLASTIGLAAGGDVYAAAFSIPVRAHAREAKDIAPLVEQEARRRAPVATAFLAAATGAVPNLALVEVEVAAAHAEQYLPPALVKDELLRKLEERLASGIVETNQKTFTDELDKLKKEHRQKAKYEAAAAEFIKKQIAQHQWKHGATTGPRNLYDIGQDEGLKPLKEAYARHNLGSDPKARHFGRQFFEDPQRQPTKPYEIGKLTQGDDTFVFWVTTDQPPETLPFEKVQQKVEDAWRLSKARPLAEAEAQRIAAQAKGKYPVASLLKDAGKGTELIDIYGIARLSPQKSFRPDPIGGYQKYVVPEDKIEYPPDDFVDKVLDLKQVGDVTVLSDKPKDTYYVAAVIHRAEPSPTSEEFRQGGLLIKLAHERQVDYRRACMEQLREQAGLVINPEGSKLAEEKSRGGEEPEPLD